MLTHRIVKLKLPISNITIVNERNKKVQFDTWCHNSKCHLFLNATFGGLARFRAYKISLSTPNASENIIKNNKKTGDRLSNILYMSKCGNCRLNMKNSLQDFEL